MGDGPKTDAAATIAVLDVGKSNVKLSAMTSSGAIVESLSVRNEVKNGSPWRHHDIEGLNDWVLQSLALLCRRYPTEGLVSTGHGSAGVLVLPDPDHGVGAALPMMDYEQDLPYDIRSRYASLSGSFFDRGSPIMLKAAHQARQMYWMQQAEPEKFARARWYLCLPQYWGWRLSGVAASETTVLSAQSHLWNTIERRWSPIVTAQGWEHLMPPIRPAWATLGPIRSELARRHGLPEGLSVINGGHDSSLNLYRYHAAGMPDACVVSTGTWIVGMCAATPIDRVDESRGMVLNSDVTARPVGGVLTMGGREYLRVAGQQSDQENADTSVVNRLIERGTFALPSFGDDDGLFPGSAGRGSVIGPILETSAERKALAVLYSALLTLECIEALTDKGLVVLDGTFLRDPLYATLVAALRPDRETVYNLDTYGIASGASLLAGHGARRTPAPISLSRPAAFEGDCALLAVYATRWRRLSRQNTVIRDKKKA
jgi:sugar (pentulose or hexulose) kinase